MPDRSLRLPLSFAYGFTHGGERGATLLREGGRPSSPPQGGRDADASSSGGGSGSGGAPGTSSGGTSGGASGSGRGPGGASGEDNPFAPPPEGTPDSPWRPRRPEGGDAPSSDQGSPWGSQWSDQQPGRSPGGFGERPGGGQGGPGGPGPGPEGPSGQGGGLRWDPTDPAQRRARYALLSGMWGFFFALFGWRYVALLLGALGLHWAISSLRAKPRTPDPTSPNPQPTDSGTTSRPQTTAAISGLVTASLAVLMVAGTFAAELVYRDYYTCTKDALTSEAKQSCDDLLPKELRPLLGDKG